MWAYRNGNGASRTNQHLVFSVLKVSPTHVQGVSRAFRPWRECGFWRCKISLGLLKPKELQRKSDLLEDASESFSLGSSRSIGVWIGEGHPGISQGRVKDQGDGSADSWRCSNHRTRKRIWVAAVPGLGRLYDRRRHSYCYEQSTWLYDTSTPGQIFLLLHINCQGDRSASSTHKCRWARLVGRMHAGRSRV